MIKFTENLLLNPAEIRISGITGCLDRRLSACYHLPGSREGCCFLWARGFEELQSTHDVTVKAKIFRKLKTNVPTGRSL